MIPNNSRFFLFAVAFLFYSCRSSGQLQTNDYLSLDTVLVVHSPWYGVQSCKNGDDIYFINYNIHVRQDSLNLYKLNTQTLQLDSYLIALPGMRDMLRMHQCSEWGSIACNGKYLILNTISLHCLFENCEGQYVYIYDWQLETCSDQCALLNDSVLVFWDMYYGHEPKTSIQFRKLQNGTLIREISPYFFHPLLCYVGFGKDHLVDVFDENILFAHKGKYAVVRYNNNLDSVEAFGREMDDWVSLPKKRIQKIQKRFDVHDAGDIIEEEDGWIHTIHQQIGVYHTDSITILTMYKKPYDKGGVPEVFLDVWKMHDGEYVLETSDIADVYHIQVGPDSIITSHSFGMEVVSGNRYEFTSDKLVMFRKYGSGVNPLGLHWRDYWQLFEKEYSKHGFRLEVCVSTHRF